MVTNTSWLFPHVTTLTSEEASILSSAGTGSEVMSSGRQGTLGSLAQDGARTPRDLRPLGLVAVVALAAVTNVVVLVVVRVERRLHHMTFYFFGSLATVHLLMALGAMPLAVMVALAGQFEFSEELCKLWVTMDLFFCNNTCLHLAFTNMDTFLRLKDPLRHGRVVSACSALLWLGAPWVISLVQAVAQFMLSQGDHGILHSGVCFIADKNFVILGTLFSFLIPTAIALLFYGLCVCEIRALKEGKYLDDSDASYNIYRHASRDSLPDEDGVGGGGGGGSDTTSCLSDTVGDTSLGGSGGGGGGGGGGTSPSPSRSCRDHVQLAVVARGTGNGGGGTRAAERGGGGVGTSPGNPSGMEELEDELEEEDVEELEEEEEEETTSFCEERRLAVGGGSGVGSSGAEPSHHHHHHHHHLHQLHHHHHHHQGTTSSSSFMEHILSTDQSASCTLLLRDAGGGPGEGVDGSSLERVGGGGGGGLIMRDGHALPETAIRPNAELDHSSPDEHLRQEQAMSHLMFVLLLGCISLWVPFSASNVVYGVCTHCRANMAADEMGTFKWLAYSTSLLGPLLYAKFSEPMRDAYWNLITCALCRRHRSH